MLRRIRAGAAIIAAVACSGEAADRSARVRDSAGVQIVENDTTDGWSAPTAWTVTDTPLVSIGGGDADSTAIFARVQNVTRLSDGRIVATDYGTRQIRFYDANGRFQKAVGRLGEGPGEFDWLGRALRTDGDSLILWDPYNARLSVFDSGGRFVRSVPLQSGQGVSFPDPFGRASDGALIGRIGDRSNTIGAIRGPAYFVRYGPDLAPVDTFARTVSAERFIDPCGQGMCGYDPPFAKSTSFAFQRDRLHVGTSDSYEVSVIGLDGRKIRSIRLAKAGRPVTGADIDRFRETFLARARNADRRAALERVFTMMTAPKTMPAYQDLRVDRLGNLWVEEYRTDEKDAPRWTVFDSAGRHLGSLATPRALRIDDIGDDWMVGVFRDSLDVEQVRLHRIIKPRRP
jgi:hypothetical protein